MKILSVTIIVILVVSMLPSTAKADRLQASGKLTFLRVHKVGSGWGPPIDSIDVEVVVKLDSKPSMAFGFQLRNDSNRPARQGMLDLLRDAFNNDWTVTIDYDIEPGKKNGIIIRVWLTHKKTTLPAPIFQYAVKFICGKTNGKDGVAPGIYHTAINVHNPWQMNIKFKKKFAIALPMQTPGRHTKFFDVELREDQALEIDCQDIFERTKSISSANFRKGFAVIESAVELDVVAVYTTANLETGHIITQDIERFSPRRIYPKLPDLVPVPDEEGSFCRQRDNNLVIIVKNQGLGTAGPSMTEVDFLGLGKKSMLTPQISPGSTQELLFEPPPSFWEGEGTKRFQITVDVMQVLTETNEENNTANGFCVIIE